MAIWYTYIVSKQFCWCCGCCRCRLGRKKREIIVVHGNKISLSPLRFTVKAYSHNIGEKCADCRNAHSHWYMYGIWFISLFINIHRQLNKNDWTTTTAKFGYMRDNRKHFKPSVCKTFTVVVRCVLLRCCYFSFLVSSSVNVPRPEDVYIGINANGHCWLYFSSRIP